MMLNKKKVGPGRPTVLSPEERLERIVQATETILSTQELDAHSMLAVAREAGMSKRTLYGVVESKEVLIELVIEHMRTRALDLLDVPIDSPAQAMAVLRKFLCRWVEAALSPATINIVRMAMDERRTFPGIAKAYFDSGGEFFTRHLAVWLTLQSKKGYLRVHEPELASELLWSGLIGRHVFVAALGYRKEPSRRRLRNSVRAILSLCNIKEAS